jgi:cell wall-associated NlpC family hydrolase
VLPASYADKTGVLRAAVILVAAMSAGACATGGGVPRPFPGAALPPGATPPDAASNTPPDAAPNTPPDAAPNTPPDAGRDPSSLISTALSFRGIPYRNGGSDPSGFDCSGFVQYVFAMHGLRLPREVRDQYHVGREVELKDVKAGDLVFFETVSRGASHVALAIGADEFVHAPSSRGVVRIERLSGAYWARRFVGARRVEDQNIRSTK